MQTQEHSATPGAAPGAEPRATPGATFGWWVLTDAVAVVAFVILGGRTHGGDVAHLAGVAVPYLVGWFAAAAAFRLDRHPISVTRALIVWPFGVALGLALRALAVGIVTRPLVIVSFAFLGAMLVGWRLIAAGISRAAQRESVSSTRDEVPAG